MLIASTSSATQLPASGSACLIISNLPTAENYLATRSAISMACSAYQLQRAQDAARAFAAKQYRIVLQMLENNRSFLDAVTQEIKVKRLLDSEDFERLWQAHEADSEVFSAQV